MLSFKRHFAFETTPEHDRIMQGAMAVVKNEMDSDKIGYYKLPQLSLVHLDAVAQMDTTVFEQIVVIGIGGSSLGIKAIDSILRPYTPGAKTMLFLENSDPLTGVFLSDLQIRFHH